MVAIFCDKIESSLKSEFFVAEAQRKTAPNLRLEVDQAGPNQSPGWMVLKSWDVASLKVGRERSGASQTESLTQSEPVARASMILLQAEVSATDD